ncbi:MAG: hypothetical protein JF888_14615 [Candidatus Dormibacteraeota bacterium]|uniref:Uncharacterized protein n=1 Tax=Candidatus Dormiibacter inghamiae TaxID=3127013 RepID=A0A934NEL9_9BACT|nr:hypothetical protein [Candidatus Dormibacteraeota bacterium]MBJ7604855.1 hypothetical protein [Candidatus Dormibacteraeota bacterium]
MNELNRRLAALPEHWLILVAVLLPVLLLVGAYAFSLAGGGRWHGGSVAAALAALGLVGAGLYAGRPA